MWCVVVRAEGAVGCRMRSALGLCFGNPGWVLSADVDSLGSSNPAEFMRPLALLIRPADRESVGLWLELNFSLAPPRSKIALGSSTVHPPCHPETRVDESPTVYPCWPDVAAMCSGLGLTCHFCDLAPEARARFSSNTANSKDACMYIMYMYVPYVHIPYIHYVHAHNRRYVPVPHFYDRDSPSVCSRPGASSSSPSLSLAVQPSSGPGCRSRSFTTDSTSETRQNRRPLREPRRSPAWICWCPALLAACGPGVLVGGARNPRPSPDALTI